MCHFPAFQFGIITLEQDSYFELCSACVHNAVLIVHCSYLLWYFNMIKSTMVFQYDSIYSGIQHDSIYYGVLYKRYYGFTEGILK